MADKLQKLRIGLINGSSKALVKVLLDDLLDVKILSPAELEFIDEGHSLCSDKMRSLVDTVKRKGDPSSEFLIQKVSERDPMLSETLGITAKLPLPIQEQNVSTSGQQEIKGIRLCSEEDFKRITSEEQNIYPIGKPKERTRLALIICNEKFDDSSNYKERKGAEFDIIGMKELLIGFGYKVQVEKNLTVEGMKNTLKTFSQEGAHKTSDSTFIVIMSHGLRDHICGTDTKVKNKAPDKLLHVDEIFNTFNNVNCCALENKPKVIIIQACRGNEDSQVMVSDGLCADSSDDQKTLEDDGLRKVQRERDFACFCSSTPDTVSWRYPNKGSLFILRLIEQMKADAYRYSVGDIFQNVQRSFKDKEQMPTLERTTLLKKFYLFPGH